MSLSRKTELLAPAGNLECALTAYKYGADAVYAGLGRFNAREMGKNFSLEDMSKLSAFAKKQGKRFYLTLNTLVKEAEIEDLVPFIDRVRELEPDAFILQDLGVINILKNYYPEIELHASTQMGFHNSPGLQTAEKIGFTRVILERQVSLEEIRTMTASSPVEVEVFIHGALCCGLSGHCLFSSWIGGWSGNRGRCKQPCRRRYHGTADGEKAGGFFFSPQDLYSLDIIGDLKEAGVASLKIEGRLKQPDYIRNVVTAYRKVLDASPGTERQVLGEARNILSGSYGRKWSHGFFFPEETKDLLQFDSMGVSGQLIGKVGQVKTSGFQVKLSRRLHVGDRIRIQPSSGEEGPAVTVTRLSLGKKSINTGRQGDMVFVHCRKEIPAGGMVYKIGESRGGEVPSTENLPGYAAPRKVNILVTLDQNGMAARLDSGIAEGAGNTALKWEEPPEPAGNRPLDTEKLKELFSATRNPELRAGEIRVEIDGAWFIPASVLKQRRREFWEAVSDNLAPEETGGATAFKFPRPPAVSEDGEENLLTLFRAASRAVSRGRAGASDTVPSGLKGYRKIRTIKIDDIGSVSGPGKGVENTEILLPHFCAEEKLKALTEKVAACISSGISRFRVTSLYQFEMLAEASKKAGKPLILTAAYPLPVANSFAAREMELLGGGRVQAWVELERENIINLKNHSPLTVEQYLRGKPFLLATRAPVKVEGSITDSRGGKFDVAKDSESGFAYIYPDKVLDLPVITGLDLYMEERPGGEPDESETSTFNFDQVWV